MASEPASSEPPPEPEPFATVHFWDWRGHRIRWLALPRRMESTPSTDTPVVLLVHGFGASAEHWRHNLAPLAEVAEVAAIDLLGFGDSDKPPSRLEGETGPAGAVRYCFDLWGQQVVDFVHDRIGEHPLHLVGNSIGGVVALTAARQLETEGRPPVQVVLIDCAQRVLDRKRLSELPRWERSGRPLLQRLVRQRRVIAPLFRVLARPAMIRRVLATAYPSGGNVDEELVRLLHRPATDPGAVESFRGFVNIFDDHLAPDLMAELRQVPVRMIWGSLDPWEDPAEARRWAATLDCVKELRVFEGLGHCPHDEAPERVNPLLVEWIAGREAQRTCATR